MVPEVPAFPSAAATSAQEWLIPCSTAPSIQPGNGANTGTVGDARSDRVTRAAARSRHHAAQTALAAAWSRVRQIGRYPDPLAREGREGRVARQHAHWEAQLTLELAIREAEAAAEALGQRVTPGVVVALIESGELSPWGPPGWARLMGSRERENGENAGTDEAAARR